MEENKRNLKGVEVLSFPDFHQGIPQQDGDSLYKIRRNQ